MMTVDQLIRALQWWQKAGYGDKEVCFDFGACDVEKVKLEKNVDGEEYIHLDWA